MAELDSQPGQQLYSGTSKDAPLTRAPITHSSQFLDTSSLDSQVISPENPVINLSQPPVNTVQVGSLFTPPVLDNGDHPVKLGYKRYITRAVIILIIMSLLFGGIIFFALMKFRQTQM